MNQQLTASSCLDIQYMLLKGMFIDNKKDTDDYLLCTSEVMDDYFWNIAKEYDIDIIIGADVHIPDDLLADHDKYGYDIIKRFSLHHIQKIKI